MKKTSPTNNDETIRSTTPSISDGQEILKDFSPLQAIRRYCKTDCCCGSSTEVSLCPRTGCALYRYRSGKTGRTRVLTEEQKAERSERMKALHKRGVL